MQPTNQSSSLLVPGAIVIGFGLIAAAIFFSGSGTPAPVVSNNDSDDIAAPTTKETYVRPVDETDYIRGNPNAPIMVIEYSDYDCPFCKSFHSTMNRVMDDYGVTGKVSWVYRQFPIAQLHPNAPRISEAAFCVGELGGDQAFWTFSDLVFEERETNEQTNMSRLAEFAGTAGVSQAEFNSCLSSGKYTSAVEASLSEGAKAGAEGTPYSVVIVGDQQAVINGAQPYAVVKQILDNLVSQIEGGTDTTTATEG